MMIHFAPSILVVDDDSGLRLALQANFLREHWEVETAAGVTEALAALSRRAFDLVLCDVRMSDGTGFDLMQAQCTSSTPTPFLFLTAYGSVPEAVSAMRDGAVDYLTKPVSFDQLLQVALRNLRSKVCNTEPTPTQFGAMVGRSAALTAALTRAKAAAATDADVLIEAESGTGKELLARFIHDSSSRAAGTFVAINCAALPETLLESELFGHARGAFTGAIAAKPGKFELAHGGTLLLDEIGDMPLNLQPKLLRVLQERVVERLGEGRAVRTDVRVIASTNVKLEAVVNRGAFRSDLFFRLNVIPLTLPPLRARPEDLALLAQHFATRFAEKHRRPLSQLDPSFLDRLQTYEWPGNVRELSNFMQRVLSLCEGPRLTAEHFDTEHRPLHRSPVFGVHTSAQSQTVPLSMDQVERRHLERTLELVGGNRTRAAEMLGISIRTMRNKIRQYDLPPRRYA